MIGTACNQLWQFLSISLCAHISWELVYIFQSSFAKTKGKAPQLDWAHFLQCTNTNTDEGRCPISTRTACYLSRDDKWVEIMWEMWMFPTISQKSFTFSLCRMKNGLRLRRNTREGDDGKGTKLSPSINSCLTLCEGYSRVRRLIMSKSHSIPLHGLQGLDTFYSWIMRSVDLKLQLCHLSSQIKGRSRAWLGQGQRNKHKLLLLFFFLLEPPPPCSLSSVLSPFTGLSFCNISREIKR